MSVQALPESLKIVAFSVGAAIAYGLIHDQITAHICVEYFSIAHPPIFPTSSPFLLALGWGVIATWWTGLLLGLGLAVAARIGPGPRLGLAQVKKPIAWLMAVAAICAAVSGVLGAAYAANAPDMLLADWNTVIPEEKLIAFFAVGWAHAASYAAGTLGGAFLMLWAIWRRFRPARAVA
ncbi:MAG: hypothetical protein QM608_09735 [Caulobacter sp.]